MTDSLFNLCEDVRGLVEDLQAPVGYDDPDGRGHMLEVLGGLVEAARGEQELDHPKVRQTVDAVLDEL